MTAKLSRRIWLLTGVVLVCALTSAAAQPAPEETPPAAAPSRPVILPMTPGAELNPQTQQTKPTSPKKPRIISVPTGSTGAAATSPLTPERPVKNATSDYMFCNRTSYALDLAVGIRNGSLFASRGWWTIAAGECKVVIKGELTQPAYYSFARSTHAHVGPIRTWGGSHTLCTGKATFQATSDGGDQCGPGLEPQGFARVETNGKKAWTTTLSQDNPGFKTLEQARIAGLQRLLYDLGRFEGPIDGVSGPKFNDALTQARSALAILANDSATLYAKLFAEAAKVQAVSGLIFCNRTQDIVWSALATEAQGRKQSQGWWRLQPGQCAKVIKDRLGEANLYAFASVDRGEADVEHVWNGKHNFCIREPSFEIDEATECEGRGFKTIGFLHIDTHGRPGVTFEFAPERADAQ